MRQGLTFILLCGAVLRCAVLQVLACRQLERQRAAGCCCCCKSASTGAPSPGLPPARSHAPISSSSGKERYVFFSMPHIRWARFEMRPQRADPPFAHHCSPTILLSATRLLLLQPTVHSRSPYAHAPQHRRQGAGGRHLPPRPTWSGLRLRRPGQGTGRHPARRPDQQLQDPGRWVGGQAQFGTQGVPAPCRAVQVGGESC